MRQAEQRVANRAADDARLLAVAVEHGEQIGERLFLQQGKIGHFVVPGTSLPSSMCAGT